MWLHLSITGLLAICGAAAMVMIAVTAQKNDRRSKGQIEDPRQLMH